MPVAADPTETDPDKYKVLRGSRGGLQGGVMSLERPPPDDLPLAKPEHRSALELARDLP